MKQVVGDQGAIGINSAARCSQEGSFCHILLKEILVKRGRDFRGPGL